MTPLKLRHQNTFSKLRQFFHFLIPSLSKILVALLILVTAAYPVAQPRDMHKYNK